MGPELTFLKTVRLARTKALYTILVSHAIKFHSFAQKIRSVWVTTVALNVHEAKNVLMTGRHAAMENV